MFEQHHPARRPRAARGLQRPRIEAALLLLALMAATTTLTLGLRPAATPPAIPTRRPEQRPDRPRRHRRRHGRPRPAGLSGLEDPGQRFGVIDHSGPYPVTAAELEASGRTSDVQAVGRDAAPASVDQPELTQGSWVRDGGVVVEAAFANALDVRVGDPGHPGRPPFEVVGVAVTAAMPPYPAASCIVPQGCVSGATPRSYPSFLRTCYRIQVFVWLTHPGGCAEPHPGSRFPVLCDEPEAGRPGCGPGVRRRQPLREPGRSGPGVLVENILERPPSWPETPRSCC